MEKEDFYPNDRKLCSKALLLFIFFIVPAFNSYGQCDNGTNFYPSATYTPAVGVWAPATASNYAGQVIKVNVKTGDVYQFSTCSGYGGVSASYNTELTLSQTFYPVSTSCGANYSKGLSLNAYPNPADSEVTFKLELEEYQGSHVYYTIMGIRGSVVASDQINLDMGYNKQVINVNNLASGTYFLRMHNTRTHIAEARIIKR